MTSEHDMLIIIIEIDQLKTGLQLITLYKGTPYLNTNVYTLFIIISCNIFIRFISSLAKLTKKS